MCLCRCRVCCTWDAEYCIRTATTTSAGFLHFLVGVLENIFFPVILLAVVMADQRVRERMYVGMRKWFSKNAARCSRGNKTPAYDDNHGKTLGDDGERGRYWMKIHFLSLRRPTGVNSVRSLKIEIDSYFPLGAVCFVMVFCRGKKMKPPKVSHVRIKLVHRWPELNCLFFIILEDDWIASEISWRQLY